MPNPARAKTAKVGVWPAFVWAVTLSAGLGGLMHCSLTGLVWQTVSTTGKSAPRCPEWS